jgi:hypothetical protein
MKIFEAIILFQASSLIKELNVAGRDIAKEKDTVHSYPRVTAFRKNWMEREELPIGHLGQSCLVTQLLW